MKIHKFLISIILFIILFTLGIRLAQNKPLWNDELYSQAQGIEKLSYSEIFKGRINEGNNFPLFYVLQKAVNGLTGYQLPFEWKQEWAVAEPRGQVILRVQSIFFMSLALAFIFYVIAAEYSILAGIYAFLIALFTETVWHYFAEARPYALWYCLSAVQALYLLRYILFRQDQNQRGQDESWRILCVVHVFLSLTAVFGTVQAFIVSVVLFVFYRPKLRDLVLMLFVPVCLGFYYFFRAQHYVFGLPADVLSLIFQNIPVDRIVMILLCVFVSAVFFRQRSAVVSPFGSFVFLILSAALAIMVCLTWTAQEGWRPFTVSGRYFIFLAPVGAVAAAVLSLEVLKMLGKQRWMMVGVAGFIVMMVIVFLLKNDHAKVGAFLVDNPVVMNLKEQQQKVKNKAMMATINHYRPDLSLWTDFIVEGKPPGKTFLGDSASYYGVISSYAPQLAEAQHFLGLCHYLLGDSTKALAAQEKAVVLEPRFFWSWYNLGVMYYRQGDFVKSGRVFENALTISPQAAPRIIGASRIYGEVFRSVGAAQNVVGPHLEEGYQNARILLDASLLHLRRQPVDVNEALLELKVF